MSKYPGRVITDQAAAGYSVYFDGASDYLSLAANAAFAFGTGDFTVEFWVYYASASANYMFYDGRGTSISNNGFCIYNYVGTIYAQQATTVLITATTPTANAWHHIAFSRSGSSNKLFIDGIQVGSTATNSTNYSTNYSVGIGAPLDPTYTAGYSLNGYISNLRVVKGTALYTAAFTPPTQLLNVTNTSLLTCNSPAIVDQSSNAFAITANGNAAVSTFTPFTAYNPIPTSAFPLTPAPGVWTLDEAMQLTQQGVWPSPITNAIEDVFSTYLYTGTGASQTITNNIDTTTYGGLVWIKGRSDATGHRLTDTVRGATRALASNNTNSEATDSTGLTAFGTTGFTIGANASYNTNTSTYASWTFREQAKFFDVVTYTGDGAASRNIAHNLGSVPGCIICKQTNGADSWGVYHRSTGANGLYLNTTNSAGVTLVPTGHTSTTFEVASGYGLNNVNGATYVAYLFAHDAGGFGVGSNENVISCGIVSSGTPVNLGWEPQFIFGKYSQDVTQWQMSDSMRGMTATDSTSRLFPNLSSAEDTSGTFNINSTGFSIKSGSDMVYVAIRRGPMRPPSSGTSVFSPVTYTGTSAARTLTSNFPVDLEFVPIRTGGQTWSPSWFSRLVGNGRYVVSSSTAAEVDESANMTNQFQSNVGVNRVGAFWNTSGQSLETFMFQRAPSFFDVVCYTGTGSVLSLTHNLKVAPEFILIKSRSGSSYWILGSSFGATTYALKDDWGNNASNASRAYSSTVGFNAQPTATTVSLSTNSALNVSSSTYVMWMWATCAGVSKVGTYTGTGSLQTINCGFTSGARFVLITRIGVVGDVNTYIYDSARGITSGNDPYLLLESTAAEVTNTNYVDTTSVGFQVTAAASSTINVSGGTYIFLAIA